MESSPAPGGRRGPGLILTRRQARQGHPGRRRAHRLWHPLWPKHQPVWVGWSRVSEAGRSAGGTTGAQKTGRPEHVSAASQRSPIRLPLPCAWGHSTPTATGLLLLLCPTQLPRPIASLVPVRTEGPLSPVQSWTPSPEPVGLSPGGQVCDGSHTQAAPRPPFYAPPSPKALLKSQPFSRGGVPWATPAPRLATCLPALGQPLSAPLVLNGYNTCAAPLLLPPSPPPSLFPLPKLAAPALEFTAAKHTHTHARTESCTKPTVECFPAPERGYRSGQFSPST